MEQSGITTAELEVALGGLYVAPKDPDAPDFAGDEEPTMAVAAPATGGPVLTIQEMVSIFGDLYTPPSLEEAA